MEKMLQNYQECDFCKEKMCPYDNPLRQFGIGSRIILDFKDWFVVPTLGCFRKGYILLVSAKHYPCASVAPSSTLEALERLQVEIEELFYSSLQMNTVFFEHGVTKYGVQGANSVDHAHIHAVPMKDSIWNIAVKNSCIRAYRYFLSSSQMYDYIKSAEIKSYLWFKDVDKRLYLISDGEKYSSQFFRQMLAKELKIEEKWDWRVFPFFENMISTLSLFSNSH